MVWTRISLGEDIKLDHQLICVKIENHEYLPFYKDSMQFFSFQGFFHAIEYRFLHSAHIVWWTILFVGVDMLLKLQARMLSSIQGFTRTSSTCKKKFNLLLKLYKHDKPQNGNFEYDWHKCRFYNNMDQWWHTNGIVMKHITTSEMTPT